MGRMEVLVYVFGSTSVSVCPPPLCLFPDKMLKQLLKKKLYAVSSAVSALKRRRRKEHIKGTDINVQSDEQHLLERRRCYLWEQDYHTQVIHKKYKQNDCWYRSV